MNKAEYSITPRCVYAPYVCALCYFVYEACQYSCWQLCCSLYGGLETFKLLIIAALHDVSRRETGGCCLQLMPEYLNIPLYAHLPNTMLICLT